MMWAFRSLAKMLTGGMLDRVLSTVDKRIDAETDRSALKAGIIKTHYETRVGFMRAGGFVLMLLFAVPLASWFSSVVLYSIFWCSGCAYPQTWSIAALPPPLDAWAGGIVLAIFGVIGVQTAKK
jgi:hypothetical protein